MAQCAPRVHCRAGDELTGLAHEWEQDRTIRERLRNSGGLFETEINGKPLETNILGAVAHPEVLTPLLVRLAGRPDLSMVSIPALENECLRFLLLNAS